MNEMFRVGDIGEDANLGRYLEFCQRSTMQRFTKIVDR